MALTKSQMRILTYPYKATSDDLYNVMIHLSQPNALDDFGEDRYNLIFMLHRVALSKKIAMPVEFQAMIDSSSRNTSLFHPDTNSERIDIIGHEYAKTEFQKGKDS